MEAGCSAYGIETACVDEVGYLMISIKT